MGLKMTFGNMLKEAMMTPQEVHDRVIAEHSGPGIGSMFGGGLGAVAGLGLGARTGMGLGGIIGPKAELALGILGALGGAAGAGRLGYGLGSMADEQAAKDTARMMMRMEQEKPGITQGL